MPGPFYLAVSIMPLHNYVLTQGCVSSDDGHECRVPGTRRMNYTAKVTLAVCRCQYFMLDSGGRGLA